MRLKVTVYYIKTKYGYKSAHFCGWTKSIHEAYILPQHVESEIEFMESGAIDYELVKTELNLKPCLVGDLSFGMGDTYSLVSADGVILHETKKYVWTCKLKDGQPYFASVTKHKKSDEGTQCFKTGAGYKVS